MTDGGGHAADLPIFAFQQFQSDPAGRDGFAEADGRIARRDLRLRIENPGAARQGVSALNGQTAFEALQGFSGRNSFDLGPILTLVGMARVQEASVQLRFVAQEQEAFRIGVETADGIHALGKPELGQSAVGRTIRRELGEDAVGFVECEEHDQV